MRIRYEDDERAILVRRFCDSADVTNAELASCIAAELEGELSPPRGHPRRPQRRERPITFEELRLGSGMTEGQWEELQAAFDEERGYLDDPNQYGSG